MEQEDEQNSPKKKEPLVKSPQTKVETRLRDSPRGSPRSKISQKSPDQPKNSPPVHVKPFNPSPVHSKYPTHSFQLIMQITVVCQTNSSVINKTHHTANFISFHTMFLTPGHDESCLRCTAVLFHALRSILYMWLQPNWKNA